MKKRRPKHLQCPNCGWMVEAPSKAATAEEEQLAFLQRLLDGMPFGDAKRFLELAGMCVVIREKPRWTFPEKKSGKRK